MDLPKMAGNPKSDQATPTPSSAAAAVSSGSFPSASTNSKAKVSNSANPAMHDVELMRRMEELCKHATSSISREQRSTGTGSHPSTGGARTGTNMSSAGTMNSRVSQGGAGSTRTAAHRDPSVPVTTMQDSAKLTATSLRTVDSDSSSDGGGSGIGPRGAPPAASSSLEAQLANLEISANAVTETKKKPTSSSAPPTAAAAVSKPSRPRYPPPTDSPTKRASTGPLNPPIEISGGGTTTATSTSDVGLPNFAALYKPSHQVSGTDTVVSAKSRRSSQGNSAGSHSNNKRHLVVTEGNQQFEVFWNGTELVKKPLSIDAGMPTVSHDPHITPPTQSTKSSAAKGGQPEITHAQLDAMLSSMVDMGDGGGIEAPKPRNPVPGRAIQSGGSSAGNLRQQLINSNFTGATMSTGNASAFPSTIVWRESLVLDPFSEEEKNLLDAECEVYIAAQTQMSLPGHLTKDALAAFDALGKPKEATPHKTTDEPKKSVSRTAKSATTMGDSAAIALWLGEQPSAGSLAAQPSPIQPVA